MSSINLAGVVRESIVDGVGIRFVVFTQGCPHKCKGCHNPDTHDIKGGKMVAISKIISEINKNPLITGVTISGGEPFIQPEAVLQLCEEIKKLKLNIMIYSGFTYEQLIDLSQNDAKIMDILKLCDVLVDGKFVQEEKSLNLLFRGSRNQRLLSIKNGKIISQQD